MKRLIEKVIKDRNGTKISTEHFATQLKELIAQGSDINTKMNLNIKKHEHKDITALECMIFCVKPAFFQCLLTHGANPQAPIKPIIGTIVAKMGSSTHAQYEAYKTITLMLIEYYRNHNLSIKDALELPIHGVSATTSSKLLHIFIQAKEVAVVKLLLDLGADPNSQGESGPAIFYAVANKVPEIVKMLCTAGALITTTTFTQAKYHGQSTDPLALALYNKDIDIALVLLDHLTRAPLRYKQEMISSILYPALTWALTPGYASFLEKLLETNVERGLQLDLNLQYIETTDNLPKNTVRFLASEGKIVKLSPVEYAVVCSNAQALQCLLHYGANLDSSGSLLQKAVLNGDTATMKVFMDNGADLLKKDALNIDAIDCALTKNSAISIPFIKKYFDLDAPYERHEEKFLRIIHVAIREKFAEAVVELCRNGARIEHVEGDLCPPLCMLVASNQQTLLMKLIRANFIPQHALDQAFCYTIEQNNIQMASLLIFYVNSLQCEDNAKFIKGQAISLALGQAINEQNHDGLNLIIQVEKTRQNENLKIYIRDILASLEHQLSQSATTDDDEAVNQRRQKGYDILRKILTELNPTEPEPAHWGPIFQPISSHQFMKDVHQWSDEEIKAAKQAMGNDSSNDLADTQSPATTHVASDVAFSWFDGRVQSSNVHPIHSNSTTAANDYVWIAPQEMLNQKCPVETLALFQGKSRYIFRADNIKKIDTSYSESFEINGNLYSLTATHELKIADSSARILLFPIPSDDGRANLYAGLKFLPTGLHATADVKQLMASSSLPKRPTTIDLNEIGSDNQTKNEPTLG